jgi:hypothetical protein
MCDVCIIIYTAYRKLFSVAAHLPSEPDSGENTRCEGERGEVFSVAAHLPSEPDSGENAQCVVERGEVLTYRQSRTPERMLSVWGRGGRCSLTVRAGLRRECAV